MTESTSCFHCHPIATPFSSPISHVGLSLSKPPLRNGSWKGRGRAYACYGLPSSSRDYCSCESRLSLGPKAGEQRQLRLLRRLMGEPMPVGAPVPVEQAVLETFFSHLGIFSYDKAKDNVEKEREANKNAGSSWLSLLAGLAHLAAAEKAYHSMTFLGQKLGTQTRAAAGRCSSPFPTLSAPFCFGGDSLGRSVNPCRARGGRRRAGGSWVWESSLFVIIWASLKAAKSQCLGGLIPTFLTEPVPNFQISAFLNLSEAPLLPSEWPVYLALFSSSASLANTFGVEVL